MCNLLCETVKKVVQYIVTHIKGDVFLNSDVINQVLILFLMIFVGIYARKRNYINKEVNDGLSKLLLKITLPLLIISSFNTNFSKSMIVNAEKIFMYAVIVHIVIIVFSKIIYFKLPRDTKGVAKFVTVFSNSGFMGYPVLKGLYGNAGVFYCSIFGIVLNVFMFSYGIMVLDEEGGSFFRELKKIIFNPAIIAIIIGMIIFVTDIKLPYVLSSMISSVGSITSPLSMIIVGGMLAETNVKTAISGKLVYILSFIKLLVVPVLTFCTLKLFGAPTLIIDIIVLLEAMPAASNAAILSFQYGGDELLAIKNIFVSTVFSIVAIPIIIKLLL
jgi:predicted permease